MSSKEIAIETGLSPQTVDTYLKQAIARLEVPSRREAARVLLAWENGAGDPSQKTGSPSAAVATAPPPSQQEVLTGQGGSGGYTVLPPVGGTVNRLGGVARTLAILKVAVISATVVVGLALLIAGGLWTFR
jgi:hypothetical protein